MSAFLSIIGMIGAFFLLKYRQKVGDMIGEADWMLKLGGVYNVIIIFSIFIFFWGLATLTGTSDFLFGWIRYIIPGLQPQAATTPTF